MHSIRQRKVSLGLGTLALIGIVWWGVTAYRSSTVRADASFLPCDGGTGRFELVIDGSKSQYLVDTCSGDVWTLVPSPIKGDPGAWAVMDRYDTREEVTRLMDFLRKAPAQPGTAAGGTATDTATDQQQPAYQEPAQDQGYQEPANEYPTQNQPAYDNNNGDWK